MIPHNAVLNRVETNIDDAESIKMGFDPEALRHIMSILSNNYGDPILAIVREYITNGLDAQVQAGVTRPVQVTPPTDFNHVFEVRDFGVGMDANDIRYVYSQYGASTKRTSNDFNGTLGIGAKSAFAYTNQFTVTSVKNGVKTNILIFLNHEQEGEMKLVSQGPTDEPSGTAVRIQVHNAAEINERIYRFCSFLPPGLVEVDGKDLSDRPNWKKVCGNYRDEDGNLIINAIYLRPESEHLDGDYVYMGGVAYPTEHALIDYDLRVDSTHIVADVPNRIVQFAPSREALMDSPFTRRALAAIKKAYLESIVESATKQINDAPTKHEALNLYYQYASVFSQMKAKRPTYKGLEFPTRRYSEKATATAWRTYADRGSVDTKTAMYYQANNANSVLYIKNYPKTDGVPSAHKTKIKLYMEDNNVAYRQNYYSSGGAGIVDTVYLINKDTVDDPWLEDANWIDWGEIAKYKLPTNGTGLGYNNNSVSFGGQHFVFDDYGLMDKRFLNSKDTDIAFIVHTEATRSLGWSDSDLASVVADYKKLHPDTTVVGIYRGRVAKFQRDFPNAKELSATDMKSEIVQHKYDQITDDEVISYVLSKGHRNSLTQNMVGSKIVGGVDDPEINDALQMYAIKSKVSSNPVIRWLNRTSYAHPTRKDFDKRCEAVSSKLTKLDAYIEKNYPLVKMLFSGYYPPSLTSAARADIIEYINNKFAQVN